MEILIITLVLVFLLFILVVSNLNDKNSALKIQHGYEQEKVKSLELQLSRLSKYSAIPDVEAEVLTMRQSARQESQRIIEGAKQDAKLLTAQAADELKLAKEQSKALRAEARATKEQASLYAEKIKAKIEEDRTQIEKEFKAVLASAEEIVENARLKAAEIAGDGYLVQENAKDWESIGTAMQNLVEGYKDKYLKPTFSLLDELAVQYGHTEAAQKLSEARLRTKFMIDQKLAAKCDYVEASRQDTAISFVLDAFNGKVDSILSRVKKDNFGTLEQMVKDAFTLVNFNAKAFRNAVITPQYLDSRLSELKWAVLVQEIKWRDQEEQRMIKEQIREEEKARKEYERAMRDAQKEEELLRKLIEKAQQQVANATLQERQELEEKIAMLHTKLEAAEEKNQRALSMAQQTRSGNVYIISNIGSFGENVYKIGMTRRLDPLDRIRELGDASVPFEFDVHAFIFSEDAPSLERELHKRFLKLQINKINPRKEFFRVSISDIRAEVEKIGYVAKWTMAAEARQYHESLAVEKAISLSAEKQQEWLEYQLQIDPVSVEEATDASLN